MEHYTPDTPQKQCIACLECLPATTEYFSRRDQHSLRNTCKQCKKLGRHAVKFDVCPEGHKRCHKCKQTLPVTPEFFHHNKSKKDGFSNRCKECAKKNTKAYYRDNKEHCIEYQQQYRQEHKDEIKKRDKNYHQNNQNKRNDMCRRYYMKHYDEIRKRKQTFKGRMIDRAAQHKRRVAKCASSESYTSDQIRDKMKAQRYKCYYCQWRFKKEKGHYICHIDHIVPLSRGGSNSIDNIVIACPACNMKKHDKLLHEWSDGGRLL